jgi:hypothetical protein
MTKNVDNSTTLYAEVGDQSVLIMAKKIILV